MVLVKVWQFRKFTLTLFWQKFREINDFTKEITRDDLTKKKKFSMRVNYLTSRHSDFTKFSVKTMQNLVNLTNFSENHAICRKSKAFPRHFGDFLRFPNISTFNFQYVQCTPKRQMFFI